MKFTKVPSDTFEKIQINAGVILSEFTPATGTFEAAKQIGATTGGITFAVTHSFTDLGDDIDNMPNNVLYRCANIRALAAKPVFSMLCAAAC